MRSLILAAVCFSLLSPGCATLGELAADSGRRRPGRAELEERAAALEEENVRLGSDVNRLNSEVERRRSREEAAATELARLRARERELEERAARAELQQRAIEGKLTEAERKLSEIILRRRRSREELGKIRGELGESLKGLGLFSVSEKEGELIVVFPTVLAFTAEGVSIVDGGRPILRAAAEVINRFPEHKIIIRGHTDDVPISRIYSSNWELSAARALVVRQFLEEEGGVDPMRMSVAGCGKYMPVSSNATAEGRRQNRRVEIVIMDRE